MLSLAAVTIAPVAPAQGARTAPATAAAPVEEPSLEIVIERQDTLIGLSRTLLDPPEAWPEVARLNRLRNPNVLRPGQILRVPLRLLRSQALPARIVSSSGEVRVAGQPARVGDAIGQGQSIETGADGSAVIELADATRVKVAPSSLAEVLASRRYSGPQRDGAAEASASGWFEGALRMLRGSIEVFATQVLRARPLEVNTPTAVVGVRGTQYRVNFDEAANRRTNSEVLQGGVRFDAAGGGAGADVAAGFGAALDQSGGAPSVARLSPAPDLSAVPERFERPLVRFAVAGAPTPLRVQVSPDATFDRLIVDQRIPAGSEVRIADLPDATWQLRVRRIDERGIEGYDTIRPFVLKARPEPPPSTQPRRAAKQTVGTVAFGWAENLEAATYRLQVARDAAFTDLVVERDGIRGASIELPFAAEGQYHWRLASTRADGDRGPFGDPQTFELRPLPTAPQGGPSGDGTQLVFAWGGRDIDRHQVELARDSAFTDIVSRAELPKPEWTLAKPEQAGQYYFRYRSVEPDGFVGPYSSALRIEVPRDWRFLWMLLPLLLFP